MPKNDEKERESKSKTEKIIFGRYKSTVPTKQDEFQFKIRTTKTVKSRNRKKNPKTLETENKLKKRSNDVRNYANINYIAYSLTESNDIIKVNVKKKTEEKNLNAETLKKIKTA